MICFLSEFFFPSFFPLFFFYYRYFSSQTLTIHKIRGTWEGIIIFLVFLLTLTFQIDCKNVRSYQTISLLLQRERLNKLRFTPLATTVYLSHLPTPTNIRNLSSNLFPECIRNKGCFIYIILITHAASETLKCLNTTDNMAPT